MKPNTNYETHPGLVSVIIPTYNRLDMVKECLLDLVAQTYDYWEAIIISDGNTDEHDIRLCSFIKQFPDPIQWKIQVGMCLNNSGCVSIPRNIGVSWSRGEFIAPFDDDCRHHPRKLELLVKALQDNPDAVLSYGDRMDYDGTYQRGRSSIPDWNPLLPQGWGVDNSQILYRSNVYEKIPFIFASRACDWELAKAIKPLGKFAHIPEVVSDYVWHGGNRSLDPTTKTRPLNIEAFKRYFRPDFPAKI